VQSARGRGADPDQIRDRVWQLKLLFDWLDRVQSSDEPDALSGHSQNQLQQASSLWLRRDFVEEARWQVWGVQIEDQG
jgi:anaphase-promoting complex subunit 1